MLYSVQPRDRIFVQGYGFLSFAKNMVQNVGKNISKNLSSNYSQKLFDHAKQIQMHLNCSKKSNSENSRSNWWFHWK